MYVAVDDTDSVNGNCTTFLATEIMRRLVDLDIIGYPRLVRLNPATPWKTRGNGSLVMRFGKGSGKKIFIGEMDGREIYCYESQTAWEPDEKDIINRIAPIIEEYHEDDADPGLVVSRIKPSPGFYWNGVRTIMDRAVIEKEITRIGAKKFEMGCGRGVIGCVCGMAWRPKDHTLELLAYRPKERWGTERKFDPMTIRETELSIPSTFNSWEERMQKVAMVPATPCPVMYGLRGEDREDLIKGYRTIKTEQLDRWMIFLTNQGTDDHIIRKPKDMIPNQSYHIEGTVVSRCRHIKGGHVFIDIETNRGKITCAAYEPSKEFRHLFDRLIPGDRIGVTGELREEPRTLNAEKVRVISVAEETEKISNPLCSVCGRTMESVGKGKGYRCRRCHTSSDVPDTRKAVRWLVEGWYEPPTAARRHLSKPLKRMGLEQPIEFVNSRIE
ncbi:MAG: tRNA(Ile)(2)-agmatinylcytidine synthase [Candidatus Methanoplasma sp.]|jgi:tRNA(Ile2)-agmatinylcytidine synthase|nr:tRNA(Ile)(2)-agmatinylcytidine synthase [Candidatus Methanoplasma sp.]